MHKLNITSISYILHNITYDKSLASLMRPTAVTENYTLTYQGQASLFQLKPPLIAAAGC